MDLGYPVASMATIRPFKATRYDTAAGNLSDLVAPPYDVLSQAQRDEFASKCEHNVVWLTLPESSKDDRSQYIKYGRSASRLAQWKRDGTLTTDGEPSLYLYRQAFTHPATGQRMLRSKLLATIKVEPYERGVVLPHEQTFPKHKEDRLRLLEATRAHLECIFGLYQDQSGAIHAGIDGSNWTEAARVTTPDGVENHLLKCSDPDQITKICEAFDREKIWIADGHHRYETAVNFRNATSSANGEIAEDYMLIGLAGMRDPGLALLPTHRIINRFGHTFDQAQSKLRTLFNVRREANDLLSEVIQSLAASDTRAFGIAMPGGCGLVATLDNPGDALNWIEGDKSNRLKLLDVTILHDVILERVLGITGLDRIEYTRDAGEAVARVASSPDTAAIITNPPSVDDMRHIAEAGEKMPQKSTYYYPKLLSGMLFWSLDDFSN